MNIDKVKEFILLNEGYRNKPYKDIYGNITIGIGRNLTGKGLKDYEVEYLFQNDIDDAINDLVKIFKDNFYLFPEPIKIGLIDMMFNMGINRFKTFKKMIKALNEFDFEKASYEIENSKWCNQVKSRCNRVKKLFESAFNG